MPTTVAMLTTIDNPWNPFDDWDEWYAFDERAGHHTTSFLARLTYNSEELSEADQHLVIEETIDEIVSLNASGLYRKVTKTIDD